MRISTKLLIGLNKCFKAPVHPFNLQRDGVKSYAMWQYEKGADTIKLYLKNYTKEEMFENKVVADIGCGAAGKSLYYASCGAKKVFGVEILDKYESEANALACELGYKEKFEFICADASALPFEDGSIDTIIMNDAMEHVDEPEGVICECMRVLKDGGRLYANFPPYHHPFGAHLSDLIYIPWVHLFFGEKTLIEAYKHLAKNEADGDSRIEFRISKKDDGSEYFSYINHMTIKRFDKILNKLGIVPVYYKREPLRSAFCLLSKLPILRELLVKMVVCVIEKQSVVKNCKNR